MIRHLTSITGGSALRAWMLWESPPWKGMFDPELGECSVLTLTYRTGVRAAIDWIFIRVQNSRS
jgi:hypothetical protein